MNDAESFLSEYKEQNEKCVFKSNSVSEYTDDLYKIRKGEYIQKISTGLDKLDPHFNYFPGMLFLITGFPQCFDGKRLIHTEKGVKQINEIELGDKVLSYNHEINETEYKPVLNITKNKPKKRMIKIKMKDGSVIKVTEDHEFYDGHSYLKVIDILRKFDYGRNI